MTNGGSPFCLALGNGLAQVFQQGEEGLVGAAVFVGTHSGHGLWVVVVGVLIVVVFDQHNAVRLLDEVLAFLGDFQDAVVLNVFRQQFVDQSLTDDGGPILVVMFVASTEELVVFLLDGLDVASELAGQQLGDVFGLEELFGVFHGFQDKLKVFLAVEFLLGETTVVT